MGGATLGELEHFEVRFPTLLLTPSLSGLVDLGDRIASPFRLGESWATGFGTVITCVDFFLLFFLLCRNISSSTLFLGDLIILKHRAFFGHILITAESFSIFLNNLDHSLLKNTEDLYNFEPG